MTPEAKLTLALEAIGAAKGIVSQAFYAHGGAGDKWCEVCHRVINSRVGHKANCEVPQYLELRKKLEAMK